MEYHFLINLLIGAFAGVLAGMFGIGGGVVIVPALIVFSGFSLIQANGTSLAALLLPVGILAVISYYKAKLIDIRASLIIATGLLIGVIAGSVMALGMPSSLLKILYSIFLLYVCWTFLSPIELWREYVLRKPIIKKMPPPEKNTPRHSVFLLMLIGTFAGVLSGMFGVGGGLVIVPALIGLLKLDTKKAVGTSLGALLLPVGLPGVLIYAQAGDMKILFAVPVAIGLLFGAVFGAKITISLPSLIVKRVYSVFILIISISFIWQEIGKIIRH